MQETFVAYCKNMRTRRNGTKYLISFSRSVELYQRVLFFFVLFVSYFFFFLFFYFIRGRQTDSRYWMVAQKTDLLFFWGIRNNGETHGTENRDKERGERKRENRETKMEKRGKNPGMALKRFETNAPALRSCFC